jgi:hypothetical protein
MVSHIVSVFSGKPIFGHKKDGPIYLFDILKQTICREIRKLNKQNTILVSHNFYFLLRFAICISGFSCWLESNYTLFFLLNKTPLSLDIVWLLEEFVCACISAYYLVAVITTFLVMVKIFVYPYNPQITKARISNIYKSYITLNIGLSMLVGISEAICLLFLNFIPLLMPTLLKLKLKLILKKYEESSNTKGKDKDSRYLYSSGSTSLIPFLPGERGREGLGKTRYYSNIPSHHLNKKTTPTPTSTPKDNEKTFNQ